MILLALTIGLMAITSTADAQTYYNVSGKVTDKETGEPLFGATAIVKGTTVGTITNREGNYTFSPKFIIYDATIVYSYIGYKTQTVIVDRAEINVQLEPDYAR